MHWSGYGTRRTCKCFDYQALACTYGLHSGEKTVELRVARTQSFQQIREEHSRDVITQVMWLSRNQEFFIHIHKKMIFKMRLQTRIKRCTLPQLDQDILFPRLLARNMFLSPLMEKDISSHVKLALRPGTHFPPQRRPRVRLIQRSSYKNRPS